MERDKHTHADDVRTLHEMGYAQELSRRMPSFSNFAISFSIICVLSGGINSLGQATSGVGGAAIGIGWPLGVGISGVFALALAQISSAYPTAGGLYHWGAILGNRFTGWLSAWLNLLGLVTVLGAINVGTFYFFLGAFGAQLGIADSLPVRVGCVAAITALQALVNHFGIGLTTKLVDFSGYLIGATAVALAAVCLGFAETWDVSRLFTFTNYTGTEGASGVWPTAMPSWLAFTAGLLLPIYTITGYDASAHTAEETVNARMSVPSSMVSSVWWSGLFGYVFLCAFILMVPSLEEAARQGWNVFFWGMGERVPEALRTVLYVAIALSQWLCGLATVTSVSRMIFAFSRDNGIPGISSLLARVDPSTRSPANAIWFGSALSVLFVWFTSAFTIAGTPVYSIVVSCTVIFLFLSFAVPIALALFTYRTAKFPSPGPWKLGDGLFRLVCILSLLSMGIIFYAGIQPPNDWALPVTVGFVLLSLAVWVLVENRRFAGPPTGEEIARRRAEIEQVEQRLEGEARR